MVLSNEEQLKIDELNKAVSKSKLNLEEQINALKLAKHNVKKAKRELKNSKQDLKDEKIILKGKYKVNKHEAKVEKFESEK